MIFFAEISFSNTNCDYSITIRKKFLLIGAGCQINRVHIYKWSIIMNYLFFKCYLSFSINPYFLRWMCAFSSICMRKDQKRKKNQKKSFVAGIVRGAQPKCLKSPFIFFIKNIYDYTRTWNLSKLNLIGFKKRIIALYLEASLSINSVCWIPHVEKFWTNT